MIRPGSSLFAKILCWFFLNFVLVGVGLTLFFMFQGHINLNAIFGQARSNRLRTAGLFITHDLSQTSRSEWSEVLAQHATVHQVDFILVLNEHSRFSSKDMELPAKVTRRVEDILHSHHFPGILPPPDRGPGFPEPPRLNNDAADAVSDGMKPGMHKNKAYLNAGSLFDEPQLMMRTQHPGLYWTGILIPLPPEMSGSPFPALLLAVSDSPSGNGFFFDPLPWLLVAVAVFLVSMLIWLPLVRGITRSLGRMTRATEEIAKGRFDVVIHESRSDEIGRLACAINNMTARLSAFVTGQKRFLGDVAHELGSPLARIQFGLGVLEQRVEEKNQTRVAGVMEDVAHLSKLVGELLAFSRADLSTRRVALTRVDLLPVVQDAVQRETTSREHIIVEVDPSLKVLASPDLLTRALANLLRNAVKYAGDAGPILISAEKKKDLVVLKVRDTGPGVPEEFLDQLFEPFFRPEPSRDRDSGGVGLGMAIVKTCIETCRGTVTARNRIPHGFVVTITLQN